MRGEGRRLKIIEFYGNKEFNKGMPKRNCKKILALLFIHVENYGRECLKRIKLVDIKVVEIIEEKNILRAGH